MRPRAVGLSALVLLGFGAAARAQAPLGYGLRLEAGAEHDSNPARLETVKVDGPIGGGVPGSSLARVVTTAELLARPGERQSLALSGGVAAKMFLREPARPEDVIVADARGSYAIGLGEQTNLVLTGTYYDVFQRGETVRDARDFRSVTPALRLERALGAGRVLAGGGYRWFLFKPERNFDFSGPSAFLGYRHAWLAVPGETSADWEWGVGASLEARRFAGPRCLGPGACPPPPPLTTRADRFLVAHTEITRTGDALLGAGVALHANRSNSFGETLTRLLVHARAVVLLPWELSLSARAELVATDYADPVPVGQAMTSGMLVSIEEEGRSTVRLELTRAAGTWAELGLRYTFYTNALRAAPIRYQRQTLLGFVALDRKSVV